MKKIKNTYSSHDMMNGLVLGFKEKVTQLLTQCETLGVDFRVVRGLRDPHTQAIYWAQSRTPQQIQEKITALKNENAPFLAKLLESVSPPPGPHITNTPPGFSWHQWGEACDCAWFIDGNIIHSTPENITSIKEHNGYKIYATEAEKIGLTAGGYWTDFKDWEHIQYRKIDDPGDIYSAQEINDAMLTRFGYLYPNMVDA